MRIWINNGTMMRDLKRQQSKTARVRQNRRKKQKQQKQPLHLRKLLHRLLRISVLLGSAALLVTGGFFAVKMLQTSELFRVERISTSGGHHLTPEQIIALSDIRPGVNSFHLDLDLIGRKIAENPWVRTARVERIFPRQVEISVEEREAVAIINLGYLYYLDRHGEVFKVLEAEDNLDYPVITGFDYQKAQEHDPQTAAELKQVVALLDDLRQRDHFGLAQLSEIHRDAGGGLNLFTLDGGVKIKLGRDNFTAKLDRLERIYAQLQPQLPILDYIDLNIDEKVIVRIERTASAAKG